SLPTARPRPPATTGTRIPATRPPSRTARVLAIRISPAGVAAATLTPQKTQEVAKMDHIPIPEDTSEPEGWRADLNPDLMAGQNVGLEGPHPEKASGVKTAYDIKNLHDRLQDLHDDDLKQVPILPEGARLEQGATYLDLRERDP